MAARREFCKVAPAIWSSKRFGLLDDRAKLLMMYFLSCPHQTSAGAFHVPSGYARTDLKWESAVYREALSELIDRDLVLYDEIEEEILIVNWFKFNGVTNPKHATGTLKLIMSLKSSKIRKAAAHAFGPQGKGRTGLDMVSRSEDNSEG